MFVLSLPSSPSLPTLTLDQFAPDSPLCSYSYQSPLEISDRNFAGTARINGRQGTLITLFSFDAVVSDDNLHLFRKLLKQHQATYQPGGSGTGHILIEDRFLYVPDEETTLYNRAVLSGTTVATTWGSKSYCSYRTFLRLPDNPWERHDPGYHRLTFDALEIGN